MKNIAFWIPNLLGGGAEKVLIDILKLLPKNKYNITLILLYKKGIYIDNIPKNIKVKYIFGNISNKFICKFIDDIFIKYFSGFIYKYFIKDTYDIEISFLEGATTKILAASNNKKSKKIAWIHTDMDKFRWSSRFYKSEQEEENVYKKYDKLIFVSKNAQENFFERFKINVSSEVIYNPIIVHEIESKANINNVKYDELSIVALGRLVKVKGFDRLIQAHSNIKSKFKHKLIIIGDGPEKENLISLCYELNVEDSVEFKGFKKNPYPYIKAGDIYVCSSFTEGYQLAMVEAIILEKPIISTNIPGPKEILENGKYGVLCENSQEGLEKALYNVLGNNLLNNLKIKSIDNKKRIIEKSSIKKIESILDE